jgi:kanamycin kinase
MLRPPARRADGDVPALPHAVGALVGRGSAVLVWENEAGGRTFRWLGEDGAVRYCKWAPLAAGLDLAGEAARLRWAGVFTRVPRVLDQGADAEGAWLMTEALPGSSAVAPEWRARPRRAVRAIGEGLRALHEALPAASCPFSWSVADRVRRAAPTWPRPSSQVHPEHRSRSWPETVALLQNPPPLDRVVVCHGDACAPNTLMQVNGRCAGHVDLDQLGVADRWADLAVATWSTVWNYGAGWEEELLAAYGVAPDAVRTAYYRLLWDYA